MNTIPARKTLPDRSGVYYFRTKFMGEHEFHIVVLAEIHGGMDKHMSVYNNLLVFGDTSTFIERKDNALELRWASVSPYRDQMLSEFPEGTWYGPIPLPDGFGS